MLYRTQLSQMKKANKFPPCWLHPLPGDLMFSYRSGYIVKTLCKTLKCGECAAALYQLPDEVDPHPQTTSLLACKQSGKLFVPSSSVIKVVTSTDNFARQHLHCWTSIKKNNIVKIVSDVLQNTKLSTFTEQVEHSQQCHILDENMRDDHITSIIRLIVESYLKLFLHQFGRVYTERVIKENKASGRHELTKQILFYNE